MVRYFPLLAGEASPLRTPCSCTTQHLSPWRAPLRCTRHHGLGTPPPRNHSAEEAPNTDAWNPWVALYILQTIANAPLKMTYMSRITPWTCAGDAQKPCSKVQKATSSPSATV